MRSTIGHLHAHAQNVVTSIVAAFPWVFVGIVTAQRLGRPGDSGGQGVCGWQSKEVADCSGCPLAFPQLLLLSLFDIHLESTSHHIPSHPITSHYIPSHPSHPSHPVTSHHINHHIYPTAYSFSHCLHCTLRTKSTRGPLSCSTIRVLATSTLPLHLDITTPHLATHLQPQFKRPPSTLHFSPPLVHTQNPFDPLLPRESLRERTPFRNAAFYLSLWVESVDCRVKGRVLFELALDCKVLESGYLNCWIVT